MIIKIKSTIKQTIGIQSAKVPHEAFLSTRSIACAHSKFPDKVIQCHASNPVGKKNIVYYRLYFDRKV